MKKRYFGIALTAVVLAFGVRFFGFQNAFAHEHRNVGDYEVSFGWQVEPAFAAVANGIEIEIADANGDPVEGAEDTLHVRVRFGPSSKVLALEPAWNEPGRYVAAITPTRPGDYSFEMTGKIGTTTVRETFTSADGAFSTIEPASDTLFPDTEVDGVSLQKQINDLADQVDALQEQLDALSQ